jgi:GAF domain-containing protein/sugar diacid utilization regulator
MGRRVVLTDRGHELRRWLAGVGDIAAAVNDGAPLQELLDLIARTAGALTGHEGSAVLLADEQLRSLVISGSAGLSDDYVKQVNETHTIALGSGPLADGPSSRAFRTAEPVPICDLQADPMFEPWAGLAQEHGYRAIAAVPLIVGGEPAGTLNCYRTSVHHFGDDELALFSTLANQAGTALGSSRLIRSLTEQRRLLERAEEIHTELTAVALRGGGMHGVAEGLSRLLSSPVLITDQDGIEEASAVCHGVRLSPEPTGNAALATDGIDEFAEAHRLTAPVVLGREVVARLWVPGSLDEIGELERRAIEHAAVVCALESLRQRTIADVEWRLRGDLLTDLLAGTTASSLAQRAGPLGHELGRAHRVLAVALDSGPAATDRTRGLLGIVRSVAERCTPRPLVTSEADHVLALWPDDPDGPACREAAEAIRAGAHRGLADQSATVVVGHHCSDLAESPSAMRTARGGLEVARLHGRDRTVSLPDLGVYGLLLQLDDPRELLHFAEDTLAPLQDYDDRRNTSLLKTVRTYLNQSMSVTRTASSLYVHPNTVGLRLRRIEELTGVSMQHPESLLRFKIALMARDVLG